MFDVECDDFGGVDAERGVEVITLLLSFVDVNSLFFSGGVKLCGRELFVIGVGGNCDGDGLAKFGECCLRGLGELGLTPTLAPGLVVPAN
jgi:hypothetical protein